MIIMPVAVWSIDLTSKSMGLRQGNEFGVWADEMLNRVA